jgi:hypothetical protein
LKLRLIDGGDGEWLKVQLSNGSTGYVHRDYVREQALGGECAGQQLQYNPSAEEREGLARGDVRALIDLRDALEVAQACGKKAITGRCSVQEKLLLKMAHEGMGELKPVYDATPVALMEETVVFRHLRSVLRECNFTTVTLEELLESRSEGGGVDR